MNDIIKKSCVLAGLSMALMTTTNVNAELITYSVAELGSGNPVTVTGSTLTTNNTVLGGSITATPIGQFAGLLLGVNQTLDTYSLNFSQPIFSIEIEFFALSVITSESLSNFSTNAGSATINYFNQESTAFNGTTIISTAPNGKGIISFSATSPFNTFSFDYEPGQGNQSGFVIERIAINTTPEVPVPAAAWLFGSGILCLIGISRKSVCKTNT